ncbi:homoserine dehydrogenase [Candidatus Leptofilum sp.]|uniref:homoserine dehydrogenase n=1 Tax=Candidatus Leptofilum sp. TaxID=3241576 RepID=UPI003B596CF1
MKEVPVILFGVGGVGSALIRQVVNGRSHLKTRNQIQFNIVAITDRKTMLWERTGLSDVQLLEAVAAKRQGLAVDPAHRTIKPNHRVRPSEMEIVQQVTQANLGPAIFVDVTAADGLEPTLSKALSQGHSVVLANKKALAGAWASSQEFFNHPRLRHESTVGGGQPVIATLRYLLDVNDPIYQIEGQLSGTLGFICTQLDTGVPLSQAIAEAKAKGYTEPDPREDLGGQDVMRKVMILGRMAGWPLEANDIEVESLYTPDLADLTVPQFLEAASQLDAAMAQRVAEARENGQVLRYVAELSEGSGTVGLKPIPADSPLANMKYISFRTGFYNDEPLLIGGKGAGVEMTAAGVLGDMIGLVREQ